MYIHTHIYTHVYMRTYEVEQLPPRAESHHAVYVVLVCAALDLAHDVGVRVADKLQGRDFYQGVFGYTDSIEIV
jgi:hypothetical protein